MKKLFLFILVGSWLLAFVNWKSVQYTRLTHPELTEWAHEHEKTYTLIVGVFRYVICPPCSIAEPVLYNAIKHVEASDEQQAWITHAPEPDWRGFYHLPFRGHSWTFVPWGAWLLYWVPWCVAWWLVVRRFFVPHKGVV